jgi:hypothetical protein
MSSLDQYLKKAEETAKKSENYKRSRSPSAKIEDRRRDRNDATKKQRKNSKEPSARL